MPFAGEQAKAHNILVVLAVKVLLTQNTFALEAQIQMKADGALVEGQCLAAQFVQPRHLEGMP